MLLRVPGLGVRTVNRILAARRHHSLRMDDLARLRLSLAKLAPFVVTPDHRPGPIAVRPAARRSVQGDLFAHA